MEGDVKQQIGLNPFKGVGIQTHIITLELNLEHGTVSSLRTSWSKKSYKLTYISPVFSTWSLHLLRNSS